MQDLKSFLRSNVGKKSTETPPKKKDPVVKKPRAKAKPKAKKKQ